MSHATAPLEFSASRHFTSWLAQQQLSLAFTTYQAGKLFLIGLNPSGCLSGFERTFQRTMGLWSDGQTMWLSTVFQLWRMENVLPGGLTPDGCDRLFVPHLGYTTGDIDIHDVAVEESGRVVFVSTLFSCVATVSDRYSFNPLWRPPFISRLAPEDRCHLNGLATRDGRLRYVTVCGRSDVVDGWREQRLGGGCVLDVESGEVVCQGLSMPHSPRWNNGRLWLLDSGTGFLGFVDFQSRKFERVAFCPGYARGLAFIGDYAIIGLSKCRQERTFKGLTLDANLQQRGAQARCGLIVTDTRTGDTVQWIRLEGIVEELYDVAVLPRCRRPKALGFRTDEINRNVWFEEDERPESWRAIEIQ